MPNRSKTLLMLKSSSQIPYVLPPTTKSSTVHVQLSLIMVLQKSKLSLQRSMWVIANFTRVASLLIPCSLFPRTSCLNAQAANSTSSTSCCRKSKSKRLAWTMMAKTGRSIRRSAGLWANIAFIWNVSESRKRYCNVQIPSTQSSRRSSRAEPPRTCRRYFTPLPLTTWTGYANLS